MLWDKYPLKVTLQLIAPAKAGTLEQATCGTCPFCCLFWLIGYRVFYDVVIDVLK